MLLSVRPVISAYGALTTDAVLEFDGRHLVVGTQDIYIFGGHPGSIQSIADAKVRDAFYQRLNTISVHSLFLLRYPQNDEIWLCYPTLNATLGRADEALVWNYRSNVWSKRDLLNVTAGNVGPIPGGGLPEALYELTGTRTANSITAGAPHVNVLSADTDIRMIGLGQGHQIEFTRPEPNTPNTCLLYTSPSPRDRQKSRMPSSA